MTPEDWIFLTTLAAGTVALCLFVGVLAALDEWSARRAMRKALAPDRWAL
jgi:hypothetical protein